ncbi:ATP-dependent Clp protease regulatory subunit [Calothrix sp. NIES-4071]|nr:ATP-dependent Clp protease regulatory subunit [Calothrix sp. NIES-4071]BAZ62447.1 ATP-dependent Clp protease regulatory subunit [Calothrix sp. NIES-4105]
MYERFEEASREVVILAQEEARRLGKSRIGTEFILLALIGQETGLASRILKSLGANVTEVRSKVEQLTAFSPGTSNNEIFRYSPTAERAVIESSKKALQLKSNLICTEHLLLALIEEQESVAVKVLMDLGISPEQVRIKVYETLND